MPEALGGVKGTRCGADHAVVLRQSPLPSRGAKKSAQTAACISTTGSPLPRSSYSSATPSDGRRGPPRAAANKVVVSVPSPEALARGPRGSPRDTRRRVRASNRLSSWSRPPRNRARTSRLRSSTRRAHTSRSDGQRDLVIGIVVWPDPARGAQSPQVVGIHRLTADGRGPGVVIGLARVNEGRDRSVLLPLTA